MKRSLRVLGILIAVLAIGGSVTAQAALHTEKVEYKYGDTVLVGYLAYEGSIKGKRPGVLVVHEWWGLNDYAKSRAEALAKEGYISLALDMYGEGKRTEHPKQAGQWSTYIRQNKGIGKERFMAAYALLRGHKLTEKEKIAAIGYCFGGHVVLSMAQEGVDLRGVVSFHGALPAERVEPNRIRAKILVCHGADDPLITQEQIRQYQENLRYAHADWQFIIYGGAKHSFTNPGADGRGMPALGYNRAVDKRSWKAMLSLFEEVFGQ